MLRSYWLLAGISATALGVWVAPGCGLNTESNPGTGGTSSSSSNNSSSGSTTGTGMGGTPTMANPPGPPAMNPPDGTGNVPFAIGQLYLGDTDRCTPPAGSASCDGAPDSLNGWKQYGFDIDGLIHTPPY